MFDEKLIEKLKLLEIQDLPEGELKPLYIELNTMNLEHTVDLCRINRADYFLEDFKNNEISLVKMDPNVFIDELENPLKDQTFRLDEETEFNMTTTFARYYGQSWTLELEDEDWRWYQFGWGGMSVRLKINLYDFMEEIFRLNELFYNYQCFFGKINYIEPKEIEVWRKRLEGLTLLDQNGHGVAKSFFKIRKSVSDEKEARFIYSYEPSNHFEKSNVRIDDQNICKYPFYWANVLKEVLIDYRMGEKEYESYVAKLRDCGLTCEIERSKVDLG